jgi:enterochelin esterase-like enzyme
MGGIMSLYAGIHYNRWFSKCACVSSAMGFCMGPLMKDIQVSPIDPDTRFFLSWGTKEAYGNKNPDINDRHSKTYQWNTRAAAALKAKGASIALYDQVGGAHCEADWEKQNPIFMNYLWK